MYSKKVEGNIAKACSHNLRISVKNAKPVCKAVRGLELKRAKAFLLDILKEKKSINGKFYTKATREVLNIILSAEKNAEFKNLDTSNMYIAHIAALDGTHMYRRRRKRTFGSKIKSAHLEVILKERKTRKKEERDKKLELEEAKEEIKKEEEKEGKQTDKKLESEDVQKENQEGERGEK